MNVNAVNIRAKKIRESGGNSSKMKLLCVEYYLDLPGSS